MRWIGHKLVLGSNIKPKMELELRLKDLGDVIDYVLVNEDDVVLHPRVLDRLELMGFYGPARCGYYRLDHHLITVLVERWRPETHIFHFSVGEVTITLQDVAIIWGVVGRRRSRYMH
ncbi:hypothetical protein ACS0TY_013087 [Phlomoides rotata]